jgi:hypothetical protein
MWKQHLDSDAVEVAAAMERLATEALQLPPPADPRVVWLKAQILKQWDTQRHTTAPIDLNESVQVGIGAAGSLLLIYLLLSSGALPVLNGPSLVFSIIVSIGFLIPAVALMRA